MAGSPGEVVEVPGAEVNRSTANAFGLVLPVVPFHIIDFKITRHGYADGWEEVALPKLREQAKSLQLILYGILEFGKTQLDTLRMQRLVQFGNHVAGGDIHAGDRLRGDDQPAHGCRRRRHGIQGAFLEEFSVGEEQRRIPPKQDQPRDSARIRISLDVVIAFDAVGAPQHGGVWTPAVPEKLGDGDGDGEAYSWNHAEHRYADKAGDREPELPPLNAIDSFEVGDLNQADRRGDDHGGQCGGGQMLKEIWCRQQEQGDSKRADDTGKLGTGTGGFRNGCTG